MSLPDLIIVSGIAFVVLAFPTFLIAAAVMTSTPKFAPRVKAAKPAHRRWRAPVSDALSAR